MSRCEAISRTYTQKSWTETGIWCFNVKLSCKWLAASAEISIMHLISQLHGHTGSLCSLYHYTCFKCLQHAYISRFLRPAINRSHIMQYRCGYCKSEYRLCSYCNKSYRAHSSCRVPSEALQLGTPTCWSYNSIASYETYVAGQEESGCVSRDVYTKLHINTFMLLS